MATTYTSLLGFALPTTGDLSGTWGDVVNSSITSLVEDSIAGYATESVAAGDWTLTTTGSGASNQARMAILRPTGSPGVTRNIIAPAKSKAYVIDNQSNASVVIKASATTGVTVATGKQALVAWNGSDFVQVGASAGGSNTQVQYNSGGSLAGSSAFTFDSATGTLSSTIYTGKLKNYTEAVVTVGTVSSSTYNLDLSQGNLFDITLGANVTFTFTNAPSSGSLKTVAVILRQDAVGNRTAAFTNAKYTDGVTPILSTGANQIDVLSYFTVNGGSFWFGTYAMANVS